MENELELINVEDFRIDYEQPAPIVIGNYDKLAKLLAEGLEKYSSLVITPANLKEAKDIHAKLNKLKKQLDGRRKEIKRDYQKPLKEFEGKVKEMTAKIDETNSYIDSSVKELETQQKEFKKQEVLALVAEMAKNYELDPSEVEFQSSWLNKSLSHKKLVEAIAGEMNAVKTEKAQRAAAEMTIKAFCEASGVQPEPYFNLIGSRQLPEILDQVKSDLAAQKQREEEERQRKAEQVKLREAAEAAKEAEMKKKKSIVQKGDGYYNTETGELLKVDTEAIFADLKVIVPKSEKAHACYVLDTAIDSAVDSAIEALKKESKFPDEIKRD